MPRETDEALRTRIAEAYGMWGAFLSHVIECSGEALDDAAKHVNLTRLGADEPRLLGRCVNCSLTHAPPWCEK